MFMLNTPFGDIYVAADNRGVTSIDWRETEAVFHTSGDNAHAKQTIDLIDKYINKKQNIVLPRMNVGGTQFQQKVWAEISKIPFGEVRTYSDLAKKLGTHPRAIARGCASNPTALLVPCHRVVGKNGGLGGYSGGNGIETKRALLKHEGIIL